MNTLFCASWAQILRYATLAAGLTSMTACGGGADAPLVAGIPTAPAPAPAMWKPLVSDTWQWQLTGTLNTSYAVAIYNIDLFDTAVATIGALRGSGKRVVCYFSAGSGENWRSDYARFNSADLGTALDGWPGERWVDIRSANVRDIIKSRLDLAASKGCDGVEPDNVDAYTHNTGFALTAADQVDYNRFIAAQAHARNLAVGLKNDVAQLDALEPHFDFAVNEQCHQYNECGGYLVFTRNGKPVLNAEYAPAYRANTGGQRDALCVASRAANLRTLVLSENLDDSLRYSCD